MATASEVSGGSGVSGSETLTVGGGAVVAELVFRFCAFNLNVGGT